MKRYAVTFVADINKKDRRVGSIEPTQWGALASAAVAATGESERFRQALAELFTLVSDPTANVMQFGKIIRWAGDGDIVLREV